MPNDKYAQGRRIEYKVIEYFEKNGYPSAWRTAGSHGPFDVIAISASEIVLAQVKSYREKMGTYKEDIKKLRKLEVPPSVKKVMVIYKIGKGVERIEEIK